MYAVWCIGQCSRNDFSLCLGLRDSDDLVRPICLTGGYSLICTAAIVWVHVSSYEISSQRIFDRWNQSFLFIENFAEGLVLQYRIFQYFFCCYNMYYSICKCCCRGSIISCVLTSSWNFCTPNHSRSLPSKMFPLLNITCPRTRVKALFIFIPHWYLCLKNIMWPRLFMALTHVKSVLSHIFWCTGVFADNGWTSALCSFYF